MFLKADFPLANVTDMQVLSKYGGFALFSFLVQTIIVFEPQQTSRLLFVYFTLVSCFLITKLTHVTFYHVTFYTTIHLCHVISTHTSVPLI